MEDSMLFLFIGLIWAIGFLVFGFNYFRGERSVHRARSKGRPTLEPRLSFSRGADRENS